MTKKAKQYPNPRFSSLEEEDEYWKTHSPLDEGYVGKVQKSKQKRTSFLSIRLTGEELTKLRNIATKFGVGPSTYVRLLLKFTIEQKDPDMRYHPFLHSPNPIKYLYDSCESPDDFRRQILKVWKALIDTLYDSCESYDDFQRQMEKIEKALVDPLRELLKAKGENKQKAEQASTNQATRGLFRTN